MTTLALLFALLPSNARAAVSLEAGPRLALEQLKEAAGDEAQTAAPGKPFRRPYNPFRGVNMAEQLGPDLPIAHTTDRTLPVTLWNPLLSPAADADHDKDGLSDLAETEVAYAFRPFFLFDTHENARRPGEPVSLFQVRPIGCAGTRAQCQGAPLKLKVVYLQLWTWDGGYGPASTFCRNKHIGDNQTVSLTLESADDGQSFEIKTIDAGGGFGWPKDKGRMRFLGGTHFWLYFSAGKHHQFIDTSYDKNKASPHSNWGCRENVDGKGFFDLAHLRAPKGLGFDWNNAGEPEAHPDAHFVGDLGPHGFGGEHAWGTKPFCGGLACKPDNPTSKNANYWSREKFFIP